MREWWRYQHMNLTEWARAQGVNPHTAYRWFREGTLPVPARRVGPRTILVNIDAHTSPSVTGGVGLYARVSSRDQEADLERQTARLSVWAAKAGHEVVRIESEVASGMNGCRAKAKRLLADPKVTTVVVEHKDRLGLGAPPSGSWGRTSNWSKLLCPRPAVGSSCWMTVRSKTAWCATWSRS